MYCMYIVPVILTVSDKSITFCGTSLSVGRKFLRTKCVSISSGNHAHVEIQTGQESRLNLCDAGARTAYPDRSI